MAKVDLIGVNHYGKESNIKLANLLLSEYYDVICHELCRHRFDNMFDDIGDLKVIDMSDKFEGEISFRGKIRSSIFSFLYSFSLNYRFASKFAKKTDIATCANISSHRETPLILIDKDIRHILSKFENLKFKEFYLDFLSRSFRKTKDVGESRQKIESTELGEQLIDNREKYMAENILKVSENYKNVACVVGAAHLEGLSNKLEKYMDVNCIDATEMNVSDFR